MIRPNEVAGAVAGTVVGAVVIDFSSIGWEVREIT
jgi:hypothetical protein